MKRVLAFSLAQILLFAAIAAAQVQTGSILVRALDEQGAVIPGLVPRIRSAVDDEAPESPKIQSEQMLGTGSSVATMSLPKS